MPPLRDRGEDALLLARHFLARSTAEVAAAPKTLSEAAEAALLSHRWPGNVRELENAIRRAAALTVGDRIEVEDLPESVRTAPAKSHPAWQGTATIPEEWTLEITERWLIERTLSATDGNKREAARRLGLSLATLYRKLAQYGGETE
jgi:DNA-binding NtrC family response regulator